jgi:CTP:molybdopterin cytidylyltransferase MocA
MVKIAGLLLAAGAGRRMGTPKALIRDPDGVSWVARTARLLAAAGCTPVVVVIGASADQVRAELVAEPVEVVEATDWAEGMGASLRAGLSALQEGSTTDAVVVVPVDTPGLTSALVQRISTEVRRDTLVRTVYNGTPGHPVLLGREHWAGVIATAVGDQGARAYFKQHPPLAVECADLADGADVDTVDDLPDGHRLG